MPGLARKLSLGLALALVVVLGMAIFSDGPSLLAALADWRWAYLPVVLLAVLTNYALRFLRWHYYLGVIGVPALSVGDSLAIFLSGFTLTMTPGKLGEVLKSFLLRQRCDAAVSYTASLVVAERITDVMGMVLLASIGLTVFPFGWQSLTIVTAACVAFVVVIQRRDLCLLLLERMASLPRLGRLAGPATSLYNSSYLLFRWRPLAAAIAMAVVAWFAECLALFLVIAGLGEPADLSLLQQSTFIYAAASLFGALSFLPGGLGATEGSMAVLLTQIAGLGRDLAIAATLLVRFATLWFAVLIGVVALTIFQSVHSRK